MIDEKWIERIQKLLNKAEGTDNPQEAETYSQRAMELMAKHAIDSAMLQKAGEESDNIETLQLKIFNPYGTVRATLVNIIAITFGVTAVQTVNWDYNKHKKTRTRVVTLVGYSKDIDKVVMLYGSLLLQLGSALASAIIPAQEHGKTFRASFCIGFLNRISQRLKAVYNKAVEESSTGTDIVLYDRKNEVDKEVKRLFPNIRKTNSISASNSTGGTLGTEAANRADLNQPSFGQAYKAIGQ